MTTATARTKLFMLKLTAEEKRMLQAVAEADSRSQSDWLRFHIRDTYEMYFVGTEERKPAG